MNPEDFFQGDSEMAQRMRLLEWICTALGNPRDWAPELRSPLDICLGSSFPIAIYWGSDLSLLYNDAWSPILGGKHPWALGRPAREVWPEIWDTIGPQFDQVMTSGVATRSPDQLLPMHRQGFTEECWFDYTFSPIRGADGKVAGIFNAVVETTFRHIGERRTQLLRHLAESVANSNDAGDACQRAAAALASDPLDLPFALLYLYEGSELRLAASCGLSLDASVAPARLDIIDGASGWPVAEALELGKAVTVEGVANLFAEPLSAGPWPEPCERAVLMPLTASPGQPAIGVLIAGASPRLMLDTEYRAFADRVAAVVSSAIAGAHALQQERARAQALAELDRAKTSFFTNVSHELRTPLTLMLGPIEEALADADIKPATHERLSLAHRNSLRLLKLVNSLLDFARIEAGRLKLELQPTDLAAFTCELAEVFRPMVERAGLTFEVECRSLGQPVAVDRDAWEKVVLNLLSNAFKFTLRGGIKVSLVRLGDHLQLSVRDTGVGIPTPELTNLFQRFHRAEGSVGRTHEGTGIGLALVQELVKLHGGTIQVDSEPGSGSCFVVTLPAHALAEVQGGDVTPVSPTSVRGAVYAQEASRWLKEPAPDELSQALEADAVAPSSTERYASTRQARVLLADDNADMRQYLSRLLQPRWRVEAVGDGIEALEAARRDAPDLVLSDVMMPRLDGFGLLAALRAEPSLSNVPVILLSARAGEESRIEGMEHGADDYLVKPFSARELLARVGAHLELGRVRREAAAALQRSRQQLEQVVGSIRDQFFALDSDWRYTFVNDRVTAVTKRAADELLGKTLWEAFPRVVGTEFEQQLREAAARRKAARFVYDDSGPHGERRYTNHVYPTPDGGLSLLVVDNTDSRIREQNTAFLASISEILARSLTPAALMEEVGQRIGAYLALSSCAFNEVDDELGVTTVPFGWFRADVPSLIGGVYRHADFVDQRILEASRLGEAVVVRDVQSDSRTAAMAFAAIQLRSFITVPFHRDGRWRFTLAVTDDRARDWREDEVELVRQLADRVFPRLERARAEMAAREAEKQLRIAGEAARLGFWTWDLASSRVEIDPICCMLFGLESNEAVQRRMTPDGAHVESYLTTADVVLSRVHPEDQQWLPQAVENAVHGAAPYDVEFRVVTPEGSVRWLGGKGDVQRDENGEPQVMAGVNLDVTARRTAEAALRASEERFRNMADSAPAMLWVTDRADHLDFISRGWLEYTGQSQAQAYRDGFGWVEQVHPDDRDAAANAFMQAARQRVPFEIQYRLHRVDGVYRWALDAGRPRFDDDGQWLGYIGSVIDIHDQKLALDALQDAHRRKDEFLATLAHELRNPLAPIRNALQLLDLVDGPVQTARIREMLQRQVGNMVRLVDDLMEASRISRGKLDLKLAPVPLKDVLRDAVETSRPLVEQARHSLEVHLPDEALLVQGDAVRLTQVFSNLLNNAAKYTEDGGRIELALRRRAGWAVVSVRDNGAGVAPEHLTRLFEMFGQLDSTASRRHGGLGIGLALAKQLTEMHGGRINAASAGVGHGSTFTVELPLIQDEADSAPSRPPVVASSRQRVLIVDDNQDAADSLGILLGFLGVETRVVHSGAEALQACEMWRPMVVLLDLGMPEMDGFEVARRLRASPRTAEVKIVALTGWGQEQDRRSTEEAGFDHHLIKPVDINVLQTLLASFGGAGAGT